jgi:hypothetical protein
MRDDKKARPETLELEGAVGAPVSLLSALVNVAVLIADALFAASITTMPNVHPVPLYR